MIRCKRVATTSQLGGHNLCVRLYWPNGNQTIVHYRRTENEAEVAEWVMPFHQWVWREFKTSVKLYFRPDLNIRRAREALRSLRR